MSVKPKGLVAAKDPIALYLQEIVKYPVLSKKEELILSKKFWKTKDPHIAKILTQANLRFVVKIAMEYTQFGAQLMDLIQEGNIGLLQAIKQFNPYKNVRLITYAVWWIKGYIQEYLMRQYSLVRIGTNAKQRKLFYLLRKEQEQLKNLPSAYNKNYLTYTKDSEIQNFQQRLNSKDISLDQKISQDSSIRLMDLQYKEDELSLEESLNLLQEKHVMQHILTKLRPTLNSKELFILDNRLLSASPLTLQTIGKKYSVTREYIRQIEKQLKQKIKTQITAYLHNKK